LEKARGLDSDAIILDLEDAVAPDRKDFARSLVAETVAAKAYDGREVVVRVNSPGTPEGVKDLDAVLWAGPDAILLPKVEDAEEIESLCAGLDEAGAPRGLALWAMIETPKGVLRVGEIAALGARRRLAALVVGLNDLEQTLRCRPGVDRAAFVPIMSQVVVAARAFHLSPLDGVFNDHRDLDGFAREARQARDLGFDGKTLIHPDQIAPCHAAFRPSDAELEWARKVIAAFKDPENHARGAITVDGKMVERLHLDGARRALALAGESEYVST
jgi:citrate lyase subunit beta/citryl-CoA lyase